MIPPTVERTIWDELPTANVDTIKLEHLFESRAKDLMAKVCICPEAFFSIIRQRDLVLFAFHFAILFISFLSFRFGLVLMSYFCYQTRFHLN